MSEGSGRPAGRNSLRTEAERRRRLLSVRLRVAVLAVAIVVAAGARSMFQPASKEHKTQAVEIPRGVGVAGIGDALAAKGIIRSPFAFNLYAHLHDAKDLKAGKYRLSGDMSLDEVLRRLEKGPGIGEGLVRVTIPEGYTLTQIARLLETKGVTSAAEFLAFARSPERWPVMNADFRLPKDTLEGYLFPDTYDFAPKSLPEDIAQEMVLNFSRRFARPKQQEIEANGRDLGEVVTLASLVEREAKLPADRPRIAGVITNRLKRDMKLEVDATVEYALPEHKTRLYYKDLQVDSPYNTYMHPGLPPGPIANPGLSALDAALEPEKNDFLYYVARPNGAHIFTRTLAQHEAAKRKAQRERRTWRPTEEGPAID